MHASMCARCKLASSSCWGSSSGSASHLECFVLERAGGATFAGARPQRVDRFVADDVDQPGHRRGHAWVVTVGTMPDVGEGLLQHLFGPLTVVQYTKRHAQEMRTSGAIDPLEGDAILQCHARHQCVQVVGCRHRVRHTGGPPLWRAPRPPTTGAGRTLVGSGAMPYAAHPRDTGWCPAASEPGRSSPWQPPTTPTRSANASWPRSARPKKNASASKAATMMRQRRHRPTTQRPLRRPAQNPRPEDASPNEKSHDPKAVARCVSERTERSLRAC